jgi:hypothetical protein
MPFQITTARGPVYVRYTLAGKSSFKGFAELVMPIVADLEKYEDDRVLFDLRRIEGRLSSKEQQLIGELAAVRLPLVFKLASLVPAGEITRASEQAATTRGLQMRVFDSEPQAVDWLLDGADLAA